MKHYVKGIKIPKGGANSFLSGFGVFLIIISVLSLFLLFQQPANRKSDSLPGEDKFTRSLIKDINEQKSLYEYSVIIATFLSGIIFISTAKNFKAVQANALINQIAHHDKFYETIDLEEKLQN